MILETSIAYLPITDRNEIVQDNDEYSFDDEHPRKWSKFKNSVGEVYRDTWQYRNFRSITSFRRPTSGPHESASGGSEGNPQANPQTNLEATQSNNEHLYVTIPLASLVDVINRLQDFANKK